MSGPPRGPREGDHPAATALGRNRQARTSPGVMRANPVGAAVHVAARVDPDAVVVAVHEGVVAPAVVAVHEVVVAPEVVVDPEAGVEPGVGRPVSVGVGDVDLEPCPDQDNE